MITQGDGAGQGGSQSEMLATIKDVQHAYTQLEVVRFRMDLWVAYFAAPRVVLFSDQLTNLQEAQAVATVEAQLSAAGVPRVPSPRGPADGRG